MYRRLFLALYLALILWGTGLQRLDACYVTLPEDDRPMLTMSSAERLALMKYHGVGSLKLTRFQVFIQKKGKWLAVNPRPGRMADARVRQKPSADLYRDRQARAD